MRAWLTRSRRSSVDSDKTDQNMAKTSMEDDMDASSSSVLQKDLPKTRSTRSSQKVAESPKKKARLEDSEQSPLKAKGEYIGASDDIDVEYHNDISALERARLENIQRNEQLLQELGIVGLRSSMATPSKAKKAPSSKPKEPKAKPPPPPPTRRSSRVTVDKLTAEVQRLVEEGKETEAKEKQAELDEMIAKQKQGAYIIEPVYAAVEDRDYSRLPNDPISIAQGLLNYDDEEKNEAGSGLKDAILTAFQPTATISKKTPTTPQKPKQPEVTTEALSGIFNRLQLSESRVAKLTPNRCTSVFFLPSSHKLLAAGGDKLGYLGIWDVEGRTQEEKDDGGVVYRYQVHSSNLMRLWCGQDSPSKLFSSSYDGTVRALDLEQEAFVNVFTSPEDRYNLYCTDLSPLSSHEVIVSKSDGSISLIDFRASSSSYQYTHTLDEHRLTSVHVHPVHSQYVVTGSTRSGVAVHDLRKIGRKTAEPVVTLDIHNKSVTGAYVSPDGKYIVSVSMDDTVKVTSNFLFAPSTISITPTTKPSPSPQTTVIHHNNQTGRWLSTFRPSFDPKRDSVFVLGSMMQPRRMEIYNIGVGKADGGPKVSVLSHLQSELLNSVCSRCCFHPTLEMVLGSNSSGKVHLFR
eukprot:gene29582-35711_t